jgi:hypothetical protein
MSHNVTYEVAPLPTLTVARFSFEGSLPLGELALICESQPLFRR